MKRFCRALISILSVAAVLLCITATGFAHSGRTDGSGGHRDNKNKSGLGGYHYHCGGYPAHLHVSGYCPYRDVFPSKVSLSAGKTTLGMGETCAVSASVSPSNACSTSVSWTSSDPGVVRVNNGTLEAVGFGTATISASTFNNKTGTIKITVREITADTVTITGFDESEPTMYIGDTRTVAAELTPENVDNPSVVWTTSNADIATVDGGKIEALQAGSVTITATTSNGKTDDLDIHIQEVIAEKITITAPESLTIGDEALLGVSFSPANTTDRNIEWSSSDKSVATIDQEGKLSAVGVGDVTITAVQKDVRASVSIQVLPIAVEAVSISAEPDFGGKLKVGETVQLSAAVSPENATYPDVTWTVSAPEIATVDESGLVCAAAPGEVTVYARSADGVEAAIELKVPSRTAPVLLGGAGTMIAACAAGAILGNKKKRG